jgi:hypothetical protein
VQVDISIDATGIMSQSDFAIRFADFSDIDGVQIEAKCTFELEKIAGRQENQSTGNSGVDFKAFPNPFNSRVIISFAMNQPGPVTAEIFDILGRRVRVLADGFEQAGSVVLKWDGTNDSGHQAAAGIYFCKIRIDSQERVVKVQYLK